jgi:hypothetical protein
VSAKGIGAGTRCMVEDRPWDRFDLDVFCQHCGTYLTTLTGVTRPGMAAARAQVRNSARKRKPTRTRWGARLMCCTTSRSSARQSSSRPLLPNSWRHAPRAFTLLPRNQFMNSLNALLLIAPQMAGMMNALMSNPPTKATIMERWPGPTHVR